MVEFEGCCKGGHFGGRIWYGCGDSVGFIRSEGSTVARPDGLFTAVVFRALGVRNSGGGGGPTNVCGVGHVYFRWQGNGWLCAEGGLVLGMVLSWSSAIIFSIPNVATRC